jgi:hypothetical protein
VEPDADNGLAVRIGELMRADLRIAALIHASGGDPGARAAAILEAIAAREQVAAGVLAEIAREDQALQSGMAGGDVPADGQEPDPQLLRRDRTIEALVSHVEFQSWEFARIARRLEAALRPPDHGLGRIRM